MRFVAVNIFSGRLSNRVKMATKVVFCLIAAFVTKIDVTSAMTAEQKEQIHQHFMELGHGCLQENPITEADIMMLKDNKMPEAANAGCFLACMFKKLGIMNADGMMDHDGAMELAKKVFTEEEELNNIAEFSKTCSSVNDKEVGDGGSGCDRAKLAFHCMVEHRSKFGFDF